MLYVVVTPQLARQLLSNMAGNRRLSQESVNAYANDIIQDNWDEKTGAAISIDEDGKLVDGQHRLHAVIKANKPIKTWVCISTKPNSIYDFNRRRSNRDQLMISRTDLDAVYHSTRFISIAMVIIRRCCSVISDCHRPVTPREIEHFVDSNKALLDGFFSRFYKGSLAKLNIAVVQMALFLAYVNGANMDDIEAFWEILKSGMATSEREFPIIAYRNYLLSIRNGSVRMCDDEIGRCQYAFKKYLTNSCYKGTRVPKELIYPFPEKGVLIR